MTKRIYIDMDDVLCDFIGAFEKALLEEPGIKYPQGVIGFFENLPPLPGAIDAVNRLREMADLSIPLFYT